MRPIRYEPSRLRCLNALREVWGKSHRARSQPSTNLSSSGTAAGCDLPSYKRFDRQPHLNHRIESSPDPLIEGWPHQVGETRAHSFACRYDDRSAEAGRPPGQVTPQSMGSTPTIIGTFQRA
jgi:hypothetical protein